MTSGSRGFDAEHAAEQMATRRSGGVPCYAWAQVTLAISLGGVSAKVARYVSSCLNLCWPE